MKTFRSLALILGISILLTAAISQANTIRCGSRLISPGDFKERLLKECGDPDYVEVWEEERIHDYYSPGFDDSDYEGYGRPFRVKVHVIVEEWTYNHGSHRFMDHVRIENGRIRKIKSGRYGY